MAKVEITLTANYVASWGRWEGIRELVQNAKDGETEHGAKMDVKLTEAGNLVIKNRGVTLPREALLIGFTTKEDNDKAIGQFGEGLKLGILALCRAGYKIRIHNGEEIWKPEIARSEKYDAEVLCFDITKSKAKDIKEDLTVIVEDVGEYWHEIKSRFLFLNPEVEVIQASHYHGELILADHMKGMIYVKGIFVEQDDLQHGYNLFNVNTDRDRRMVNKWDKKYHMGAILGEAARKKSAIQGAIATRIFNMLEQGSDEVSEISSSVAINNELKDKLGDLFKEKYGNAVPVYNADESRKLEAIGKQGVVLPMDMANLMSGIVGSFQGTMETASMKPAKLWSWHELTEDQKLNVSLVIRMFEATGEKAPELNIVDFIEEDTLGKCVKGQILIAHKMLDDLPELLHTYVHEWAHLDGGGDVDLGHREMMGMKLAQIAVKNMKGGN